MSDISPSVFRTAFACPHCQAHAAQTWYSLYASPVDNTQRLPLIPQPLEGFLGNPDIFDLRPQNEWTKRMLAKEIFLDDEAYDSTYQQANNIFLSACFNCSAVALWHNKALVFPPHRMGESPNKDLNQDIREDMEEARAILDISPRGAAALLRLAVQKMCRQLGESGKNIDSDIQKLVDNGLHPHLQQAFDAVRVIGNEAVHPGELNLKDDRETAVTLLSLINIVAQELISNKKAIAALYASLPLSKLKGIEDRAKVAAAKLNKNKE